MILLLNFLLATLLVSLTFIIQFMGLVGLAWLMRRREMFRSQRISVLAWQGGAIVVVILALFAIHALQIWAYALVYLFLGEFKTLEPAIYFSTTTFTTVGFGEIVLGEKWRLLAAIESLNGFLAIGWSTAFMISISDRLRAFEADIEESLSPQKSDLAAGD